MVFGVAGVLFAASGLAISAFQLRNMYERRKAADHAAQVADAGGVV